MDFSNVPSDSQQPFYTCNQILRIPDQIWPNYFCHIAAVWYWKLSKIDVNFDLMVGIKISTNSNISSVTAHSDGVIGHSDGL